VPAKANDAQLAKLRRVWSALGDDDPLWAVLSHADKQGRRWNVDEFLETGRVEIEAQLAQLANTGYPRNRGLALDFGCGAGRLTLALAAHFEQAVGVDVSPSMVRKASTLHADVANLRFLENATTRIEGIAGGSVDLVYSCITLQHIPGNLALGYVAEFLRLLAPGGVAAFQFVAGTDSSWRGRLFAAIPNRLLNPLRRLAWRRNTVFEMHALDEAALRRVIAHSAGMRLLGELDDASAGPGWRSRRWFVVNDCKE
jgi:SAM-dependent methyltransferase